MLKQQSFSINLSSETISPGKSMFKTSEVNAGKKMAIAVNYQPSEVPLNIQVIQQPDLAKYWISTLHTDYLLILCQAKMVWITL